MKELIRQFVEQKDQYTEAPIWAEKSRLTWLWLCRYCENFGEYDKDWTSIDHVGDCPVYKALMVLSDAKEE